MDNEEIQRILEFIIRQQEQFAENMGKAEARMSRMETAMVGVFSLVTETAKAQKETAKRVDELTAAQAHTDERLSALINTVERYISEGRNGKSQ
ncbi:MAG: hypothetical protein ABR577_16085 [Pyrinomonadaceae bacterium]